MQKLCGDTGVENTLFPSRCDRMTLMELDRMPRAYTVMLCPNLLGSPLPVCEPAPSFCVLPSKSLWATGAALATNV